MDGIESFEFLRELCCYEYIKSLILSIWLQPRVKKFFHYLGLVVILHSSNNVNRNLYKPFIDSKQTISHAISICNNEIIINLSVLEYFNICKYV